MTDSHGLMQAIIDHTDDEGLRLVYADWLEEQGEAERAELIRVQCRLAHLAEDAPERPALELRDRVLTATAAKDWCRFGGKVGSDWRWHGGLPEAVTLGSRELLQHGADLFALAPIRDLTLRPLDPHDIDTLAASPLLGRLHSLDVSQTDTPPQGATRNLLDSEVTQLIASPHLGGLRRLVLARNRVGTGTMRALVAAHHLSGLRELDLQNNVCGAAAMEILAQARLFTQLTHLDLSGNVLGAAGLQALAASPLCQSLTMLRLTNTQLQPTGLGALASSPHFKRLVRLEVNGNPALGSAGLEALAASRTLGALTELNLSSTALGLTGTRALAASATLRPHFLELGNNHLDARALAPLANCDAASGLTHLDLWSNPLGDDGAKTLASSARLGRLRFLGLAATGLSAWGVKDVASANHFGGLETLNLQGNGLGDEALQALAAFPQLAWLRCLDLSANEFSDDGVRALATTKHLRRLTTLVLNHTRVGDAGLLALWLSPFVECLTRLEVAATEITERGLEALLDLPRPPRLVRLFWPNPPISMDPGLRQRLERHFGRGVCRFH